MSAAATTASSPPSEQCVAAALKRVRVVHASEEVRVCVYPETEQNVPTTRIQCTECNNDDDNHRQCRAECESQAKSDRFRLDFDFLVREYHKNNSSSSSSNSSSNEDVNTTLDESLSKHMLLSNLAAFTVVAADFVNADGPSMADTLSADGSIDMLLQSMPCVTRVCNDFLTLINANGTMNILSERARLHVLRCEWHLVSRDELLFLHNALLASNPDDIDDAQNGDNKVDDNTLLTCVYECVRIVDAFRSFLHDEELVTEELPEGEEDDDDAGDDDDQYEPNDDVDDAKDDGDDDDDTEVTTVEEDNSAK